MKSLWGKNEEIDFFLKTIEVATPEQLFYVSNDNRYYAYWPKGYIGKKETLQSRNAFIGSYTEKWCKELFTEIAEEIGAYAVQGVTCNEIELSKKSSADLAICKTNAINQISENILLIIEVKMSVVWNWEYKKGELICLGDFRTHQGNPGLLRSDTMLKAIGKSLNIKVSSCKAAKIPIIVIGNTPVTNSYFKKVDNLKRYGIIQGFWSVNPSPVDNGNSIKNTDNNGFYKLDNYDELKEKTLEILKDEKEFFTIMKTRKEIGRLIEVANREQSYESKAQKFLEMLKDE